jgi:hypothetical protein
MQMTIATVTFFVGLALVIISIFGGGLEIKEIKIPTLSVVPRVLSFAAGTVLIIVCVWFPQSFPTGSSPVADRPAGVVAGVDRTTGLASADRTPPVVHLDKSKTPPFLGAAIKNNLVTVQDVKRILRHVGKYTGPIDDDPSVAYFQAVAEFQVSHSIDADGYVGPVTYAKLREAWPEFFAAKPQPAQ